MPSPRPEILTIHPYIAGESAAPGANRIIKLSSNEGAFGVPPSARAAIAAAADEVHRYPDGSAGRLRAALGKRWNLDPDRIVCGAGSDDIIYQLCLSYGGPGRDVIMSAHGFSMYQIAGIYAGSRVIKVPERDLTADLDAMLAAVSPSTRLMFLANPNNPTGSMLRPKPSGGCAEPCRPRCFWSSMPPTPNMSPDPIMTPAQRWWTPRATP